MPPAAPPPQPPGQGSQCAAQESGCDESRPSAAGGSLKKAVAGLLVVAAGVAGWMHGGPRDERPAAGPPAPAQSAAPRGLLSQLLGWVPEGGPLGEADVAELLAQAEGQPEADQGAALDGALDAPAGASADGGRFLPEGSSAQEPPDGADAAAGESPQAGSVQFHLHRVQEGETLWDIARRYRTDVNAIASANGLYEVDYIRPGQVLEVPDRPGVVHTVQAGETLWEISRIYGVSVAAIQEANGLESADRLLPSTRLFIPGVSGPVLERLVVGGRLQRAFSWPARDRISSRFGWRWGRLHEGIDIAVPAGTPVRAAAPGRVVFAGWGGGYGYLVSIDHGSGVVTRYAHNSRLAVRVGQRVARGQIIAYSGSTGNSTGPHVHFEIRFRGRPVDPLRYLR